MSQSGAYGNGSPAPGTVLTLTGNSGGAVGPTGGNINVIGSGFIDVTGNPGTSTLTITVTGSIATQYDEDVGSAIPVAGILNVIGGATSPIVIPNINTTGSGNTIEVALNNTIYWPDTNVAGTEGVVYIEGERWLHTGGHVTNIFLGYQAGNFTNGTNGLIAIGQNAYQSTTTSSGIAIGSQSCKNATVAAGPIGIGGNALNALINGDWNIAIGNAALWKLTGGHHNIVIGPNTGVHGDPINRGADAYVGNETANIIINNIGVAGESNTIRIGTTNGADPLRSQNRCFIAGIDGVNVGSVAKVVTMASNQLGTATITAGTNITITPGANTITIAASGGSSTLTYTAVNTTPYTVMVGDQFLGVDCSGGAITIKLPNAPSTGQVYYIKDSTGNANVNAISVTTVGGVVTIDGSATFTINVQYESINVLFNGTLYEVF